MPKIMFDESRAHMTPELEQTWGHIKVVYSEAERFQTYHEDENAWSKIVRLLLEQRRRMHLQTC